MIQVERHTIVQILGSLMKKPELLSDTDKYIFDVNEFNVPFGKKLKVNTYDGQNLGIIHSYFNFNDIKMLSVDFEEAVKLEKKIHKQDFTLQDYLDQLKQIKKMGSLKSILGMIGIDEKAIEQAKIDDKQFVLAESIIQSMTVKERNNPDIINGQRRRRIADGSGTTVQEVNKFLKQYNDTRLMMKRVLGNKSAMNRLVRKVEKNSNLKMEDLKLDD